MNFKEKLLNNSNNIKSMHMPGHKRNKKYKALMDLGMKYDFTETSYLDDLHNPEGIILQEEKKAAKLYGTEKFIFGVNGSTGLITTVIYALSKEHSNFMAFDNCHYSIYNALKISQKNIYLFSPKRNEDTTIVEDIDYEDLEHQLTLKKIEALILTYPDYEGQVLKLETISEICHKLNVILVVDQAHGAHFGLSKYFPENAIKIGADFVIQSLHKTLPSLTQTAVMMCNEYIYDKYKINDYIKFFETSSPSFILISSICECMDFISKNAGDELKNLSDNLDDFYKKSKKLKHLKLLESQNRDKSKIVILTDKVNLTGYELKTRLLNEFNFELECAGPRYALAYSTIADDKKVFDELITALFEIDKDLISRTKPKLHFEKRTGQKLASTFEKTIYAYPPATPVIFKGGEEVTDEQNKLINQLVSEGMKLQY